MDPLVLTAELDAAAFAHFDELRQRHFPPERNLVPAHITLFHQLPGEEQNRIENELRLDFASEPILICVIGLRSLGGGVSYSLQSPALSLIHKRLSNRWDTWLTRQDRQAFHPHIVIQNKAAPIDARALLATLRFSFEPWSFHITAFLLWHYRGGPWELAARFPLGNPAY